MTDFDLVAQKINSYFCFEPAPFDNKSAYELAAITNASLKKGDKRSGVNESWQKVKFDRLLRLKKSFLGKLFETSKEKVFK